MRGSPRSLMLSWANRVAGWWTQAALVTFRKQQAVMTKEAVKALIPKTALTPKTSRASRKARRRNAGSRPK